MASPLNDSYTVASGVTIYAGKSNRPAWRNAITKDTWATLGPSSVMTTVDPANDPTINPNYPATPPWQGSNGISSLTDAWGGGAYNPLLDEFSLVGGGHTNCALTSQFRLALNVATPYWTMVDRPAGAIGDVFNVDDGGEALGHYARPGGRIIMRSVHSYNLLAYIPTQGLFMSRMTAQFKAPVGVPHSYLMGHDGVTTLASDFTALNAADPYNLGPIWDGGAATYDPVRNCVWHHGSNSGKMAKYDCATGVTTVVGGVNDHSLYGDLRLVYLDGLDVIACIVLGLWTIFDPATFAYTTPSVVGSYVSGYTFRGFAGATWDKTNQRLLLWHQSTNREQISTLTPGIDPRTSSWTAGIITPVGSNTVTPPVPPTPGTHGRFFVSTNLGAVFLVNGVNQQVYAYALD